MDADVRPRRVPRANELRATDDLAHLGGILGVVYPGLELGVHVLLLGLGRKKEKVRCRGASYSDMGQH